MTFNPSSQPIILTHPINTLSSSTPYQPSYIQCLERFLAVSLRHEGNDGMNTMKASDKLGTYYYLIAYTLPVTGQPVQLSQVILPHFLIVVDYRFGPIPNPLYRPILSSLYHPPVFTLCTL